MNTLKCIKENARIRLTVSLAAVALLFGFNGLKARASMAQVEIVPSVAQSATWVDYGRVEGHLALEFSPAAAFSPDSSRLAVVDQGKVDLMNLQNIGQQKGLYPRLNGIGDLNIQSASFLDDNKLFLLANGMFRAKGKPAMGTPLLGFQWDISQDALSGKVDAVGAKGGYGRPRYFPVIKYLAMYKDSTFTLWSPITRQGLEIKLPSLTREPRLYTFSPDGHWLLLAQIAGSGSPDPVVVRLSDHTFVNTLPGHQGTVMSMAFSRDGKKVVTGCEDGKIRVWSVPDWKLLETLEGHEGPVHWAEFSPDGRWIASAGEDQTVRIWSAGDGKLVQTLRESQAPVLTVAFSPDGNYVAASTERAVLVWKKTVTGS